MNKTGKILIYSGITLLVISFLLAVYFKWEDWYSLKASHSVMEKMISKDKKEDVYEDNGFKVIKIEGIEYIGYIEIPSLGLNLPVTNGYSYATLKKTPALYYGNIDSNFVICGHSYKAHFGNCDGLIGQLQIKANGDVLPCCYDFNSKLKIGNIHDKKLSKILLSDEYNYMSKKISGKRVYYQRCKTCLGKKKICDLIKDEYNFLFKSKISDRFIYSNNNIKL